jgi:hypothetical protein
MFKMLVNMMCLAAALVLPPKDDVLPVANNTWSYFQRVTYPNGLPDDRIDYKGGQAILPDRTTPSNIGFYLFSVDCAYRLKLIDEPEAIRRVKETIHTLSHMERRHGFFLNWYKASDSTPLTEWVPGTPIPPFLSSIDNAWLAASLFMVREKFPDVKVDVSKILEDMDFRFFYDTQQDFFRGGWDDKEKKYTFYHYGILNSETRLVSYIAIYSKQVPQSHLHKLVRVKRDDLLVSSYGSMFEALVVPLFVPEFEESTRWKEELTNYAKFQIDNPVGDFWGMSYSDDARGVYKEFGCDRLAQYPAHFETEGVVTPYASFLALQTHPVAARANIAKLKEVCYGEYGFYGAYRPKTGERAKCILTLEQTCIMMAICDQANENPSKKIFKGLVEFNFP